MKILFNLSVAAVTLCFAAMATGCSTHEVKDQVHFCSPQVSPTLVAGRSNFSIIYQIELDETGTPVATQPLKQLEGVEALDECLMNWRLPSHANDRQVKIVQSWVHGRGWTVLQVSATDRTLVIQIPEDLSPYTCSH